MKFRPIGVVGDIGGTHSRFALVDEAGHIRHPKAYQARDHAGLSEVLATYLEDMTPGRYPTRAVLAVAGPVVDGEIEFTNIDWRISEGELVGSFAFESARLLNDFAAQALAAPVLEAADLRRLGPDLKGTNDAPVVVLGAGTGFGVGGLARSPWGDVPIAAEGGHASFAASDAVEDQVLVGLRQKYGRVSVERILSGPGLFELYQALGQQLGLPASLGDERAVIGADRAGDPLVDQTLDRFCGILGSVAGDIALTYGARGGVYIAGGIGPRIADRLANGSFRERFEAKGRLSDYMREIPTALILHPYAALVGAARELKHMEGRGL